MTKLRKYKHVVAVILFAVYAFIATPVQFWHHHNYAATSISSLQSDDAAKIAAPLADNKTIKDSCQICSHHYAIYSNDAEPAFEIVVSPLNSTKGFYALAIPLAPYFDSTNKGPPTEA